MRSPINSGRRPGGFGGGEEYAVDASEPTSLAEVHARMLRGPGLNFGGVYSAGGAVDMTFRTRGLCDAISFDIGSRAGAKVCRIPASVHYWAGMDATTATLQPAYVERIKSLAAMAAACFDVVVIDPLHDYHGIKQDASAMGSNYLGQLETSITLAQHITRTQLILTHLSTAFATVSHRVIVEVTPNEVDNKGGAYWTTATWNVFAAQCVTAWRAGGDSVLPSPRVLVTMNLRGGVADLVGFVKPGDANVLVTFHPYDHYGYTHQGLDGLPATNAYSYARWCVAAFDRAIAFVVQWIAATGYKVFAGEYGVTSGWDGQPLVTDHLGRAEYYSHCYNTLRAAGIPSTAWSYGVPDFGIAVRAMLLSYDSGWAPGFPAALRGETVERSLPDTSITFASLSPLGSATAALSGQTLTISANGSGGVQNVVVISNEVYAVGRQYTRLAYLSSYALSSISDANFQLGLGGVADPSQNWPSPVLESGAMPGPRASTIHTCASSAVAAGSAPRVFLSINIPAGFSGGSIDLTGLVRRVA